MSSFTEIETRAVIADRLRRARDRRQVAGVHPRHRFFGTRSQPATRPPE